MGFNSGFKGLNPKFYSLFLLVCIYFNIYMPFYSMNRLKYFKELYRQFPVLLWMREKEWVSYVKMYEISELHSFSGFAPVFSIMPAKFSVWFLTLLIFFASVCTMTSVTFYVLYTISSVLSHISCPVPLGILFSLQTQHRIKNVPFSPCRTKIQDPLSL